LIGFPINIVGRAGALTSFFEYRRRFLRVAPEVDARFGGGRMWPLDPVDFENLSPGVAGWHPRDRS